MSKKILIISGGKLDLEFAREYLTVHQFDMVVCADSGLNAAYRLKIKVDYIMGDFDSVSTEIMNQYRNGQVPESPQPLWVDYPREKDATDTHMVISWVVDQLPSKIVILGATGGRLDHFLANLNLLMKPMAYGIPAYLIDRNNKIYLIDHSHVIYRSELYGKYISLQPLTEEVYAVFLRGFKYPLNNFTFTIGDSRGVSNELEDEADAGLIEMGEGVLIVIESKD